MATYSDLRYPLSERTTIVDEKQTKTKNKPTKKFLMPRAKGVMTLFIYLFLTDYILSPLKSYPFS